MIKATSKTATYFRSGLLVGLLLLSACSMMPGAVESQPCPPVSTLGDAKTVSRFVNGPGRDLIDIDFTGEITKLSGKCVYEMDYDAGTGEVRVTINTEFKIVRGAANKTRQADFEYFVSVVDDRGQVINKLNFPFTAKYWKNRSFTTESDVPIDLSIDLSDGRMGTDYSIYVGFQLSPEELDFNRGKIGQ